MGTMFRWFGTPLRLDGARAALLLAGAEGQDDLRTHLPRAVAKLTRGRGSAAQPIALLGAEEDPDALIVTDGTRRWSAIMVETESHEALLVFSDGVPPPNTDLRVAQSPILRPGKAERKTICFTAGTRIATPDGPRAVEDLYPGDLVETRDDGPQEVLWVGLRQISGARMFAMPALRPVRIRAGAMGNAADLIVSPGHQLLLSGPKARALWNTPEVLVRAKDLIDDRRVTPDHAATEVTYVHLLFRRHQVIWANGIPAESFHPGDTDLAHLNAVEIEDLSEQVPGIEDDPAAYGPHARRCLSAAELAILRHEGAPRYLS